MFLNSASDNAPLFLQSDCPLRNNISVGTDWILYWPAGTPCLSTSILMMRMLSPNASFSCSRIGCIILQGWHHVAKKSTNTSLSLNITSLNVSIICILSFNILSKPHNYLYDDNEVSVHLVLHYQDLHKWAASLIKLNLLLWVQIYLISQFYNELSLKFCFTMAIFNSFIKLLKLLICCDNNTNCWLR